VIKGFLIGIAYRAMLSISIIDWTRADDNSNSNGGKDE
jgi:hypothetical protein